MPETCRLPVHPLGVLWGCITSSVLAVALIRPAWFDVARLGTEGPVEHVAHAVLLASMVAWIACVIVAIRVPGLPRVAASMVTAYVALLFMEEIDWGAVYGLTVVSDALRDVLGTGSLHQNTAQPRSILEDKLFWLAVPAILWFGVWRLPHRRVRSWAAHLSPVAPTTTETRWFFVGLATCVVLDMTVRDQLLDLYQLFAYAVLGWSGWRARTLLLRPNAP